MSEHPDTLLGEIKLLIEQARSAVARSVNSLQVRVNFEIGRRIVEEEQRGADRAEYGRQLLVGLADGLTQTYGRGLSRSNLEYMRKFFLVYREPRSAISQKPSGKSALPKVVETAHPPSLTPAFKLSWSH